MIGLSCATAAFWFSRIKKAAVPFSKYSVDLGERHNMIWHTLFFLAVLSPVIAPLAAQQPKQSPPVPAPVTYRQDVSPILAKHCQGCHKPGQIAPISFTSYETTRPWAQQIKATVQSKKMPPAVTNPHYALFTSSDALTAQEIETIVKWVDGGAVEGAAEPLKTKRKP
jgi:mono/diheme cytochrome c family protein